MSNTRTFTNTSDGRLIMVARRDDWRDQPYLNIVTTVLAARGSMVGVNVLTAAIPEYLAMLADMAGYDIEVTPKAVPVEQGQKRRRPGFAHPHTVVAVNPASGSAWCQYGTYTPETYDIKVVETWELVES